MYIYVVVTRCSSPVHIESNASNQTFSPWIYRKRDTSSDCLHVGDEVTEALFKVSAISRYAFIQRAIARPAYGGEINVAVLGDKEVIVFQTTNIGMGNNTYIYIVSLSFLLTEDTPYDILSPTASIAVRTTQKHQFHVPKTDKGLNRFSTIRVGMAGTEKCRYCHWHITRDLSLIGHGYREKYRDGVCTTCWPREHRRQVEIIQSSMPF